MTDRLHTVSLRRRVTALSLAVLAAVLLVVVVLTDVLFASQSRADMRAQLAVRANLAGQLVGQGAGAQAVARRVAAPGISALLVTADGRRFGELDSTGAQRLPNRATRGDDQVLRRTLADGSQLTLVADTSAATLAQQRLRRTLILLGLAALAVAGVITLVTTRLALAPLDAMTGLARSITRGDRGRRLAPPRTDTELGRAAAAFDDMLDELEGAELAARAAAERTRRFVADAAHELRTPLAGVQAVAEAAMAPQLTPEERERLHLLLLRESRRAARLVDDLLALARIDAGIELRRAPVNLLDLAHAEVERVRLLAPGREIDVAGAAGDRSRGRRAARSGAGQPARQRLPAHPGRRPGVGAGLVGGHGRRAGHRQRARGATRRSGADLRSTGAAGRLPGRRSGWRGARVGDRPRDRPGARR